MGTEWKITIWDDISKDRFLDLIKEIVKKSEKFDLTYSRFKPESFVSKISQKKGEFSVEKDFMNMLVWYRKFYLLSEKKLNPLIGFTISDLGYDAEYSLIPKKEIRKTPDLFDTVEIVGEDMIRTKEPVLFDFGALGKGYFVDVIANFLRENGVERFLVDGSGDVFYEGGGISIVMGLEHPYDPTKVIGSVSLKRGAMCSSGTNRRRWANLTHVIDPHKNTSVEEFIIASWVTGDTAVFTDGLATCLFFCSPESFSSMGNFEYCLARKDLKIKKSPGFEVELFV
jgi:thiamine biosynthesis lipoprotein